jgi:hypothetical protein
MKVVIEGKKSYDFRTPINTVTVEFDEDDKELMHVFFQCTAQPVQVFKVWLDHDEDGNPLPKEEEGEGKS